MGVQVVCAAKSWQKNIKFKPVRFMTEKRPTNQLPPVITYQLTPTRPPTEPVAMPKRARAAEAKDEVGDWADLPIMIRVHFSIAI